MAGLCAAVFVTCGIHAQTAADKSDSLEEVVVTGSRVITNGDNSPTPVTIITAEDLQASHPGNIYDALQELPAFTQSRNQTANPGAGGGSSANSAANNSINTMNMRALGSSRTLVLYDGRRLPAVSPEGYTDVNMIPQLLLQRVDTVTGGASAVYGSDAIGGVVNFVSERNFTGIKGEFRAGRSVFNDGDIIEGGLAVGPQLFGGSGHFTASYSDNNDAGVSSRLTRPWGRLVPTLQGGGVFAPLHVVVNGREDDQSLGGKINSATVTSGASLITAANANNLQFVGAGGFPVVFNHGLAGLANGIARTNIEIGGDGGYQDSTLKSNLNLHQGYARLDFDFTDHLHGFVNGSDMYAFSSQALG
jgi:outer membrane receptor protein involved in Fe transport